MNEASFRSFGAQIIGARAQLDELDLRLTPRQLAERVDRQRAVEIEREQVVAIDQRHPARQTLRRAQSLHRDERCGRVRVHERTQLGAGEVPARWRQDHATHAHSRQEARARERSPGPAHARAHTLPLERTQETVEAEAARRVVVRVGEARHDLTPEGAPSATRCGLALQRETRRSSIEIC